MCSCATPVHRRARGPAFAESRIRPETIARDICTNLVHQHDELGLSGDGRSRVILRTGRRHKMKQQRGRWPG